MSTFISGVKKTSETLFEHVVDGAEAGWKASSGT